MVKAHVTDDPIVELGLLFHEVAEAAAVVPIVLTGLTEMLQVALAPQFSLRQ